MTKIQETEPPKEALILRETLEELGFNTTPLGSEGYVMSQLRRITGPELSLVRQAFIRNPHPRFLKEFFYHLPYGKKEAYKQKVQTASLEKLAKLIHVTVSLLQTKIYLF
jgi:hypothetical protein